MTGSLIALLLSSNIVLIIAYYSERHMKEMYKESFEEYSQKYIDSLDNRIDLIKKKDAEYLDFARNCNKEIDKLRTENYLMNNYINGLKEN